LLVPRVLSPAPRAAAALLSSIDDLLSCGIELADFGAGTIAIKALPQALSPLSDAQLTALLGDLADELQAHGRGESLAHLRDALLARAACHASVRAHDPLAAGEAQALLDALDGTDYGARCAHGRPVVAEWNTAEIEKRFGRDYATHSHAAPPESL
jgi:DNA mismatch repair protein MutL